MALVTTYNWALLSIVSLWFMGSVNLYAVIKLSDPQEYGCAYAPAVWTLIPFIISCFNCFYGSLVEIYLLLIGKLYRRDLVPGLIAVRNWNIPNVTGAKLCWIFSMVLATGHGTVIQAMIYFGIVVANFVAPLEAFQLPLGKTLSTPVTLGRIAFSLLGCKYGGWTATALMVAGETLPIAAVAKYPPDTAQGKILSLPCCTPIFANYFQWTDF